MRFFKMKTVKRLNEKGAKKIYYLIFTADTLIFKYV